MMGITLASFQSYGILLCDVCDTAFVCVHVINESKSEQKGVAQLEDRGILNRCSYKGTDENLKRNGNCGV